jgi:hypothetical protein
VGGYSIQAAEGPARGLIIAHASEVMLRDVKTHINHNARTKCLTSKKRVHAGFKGTLEAFRGTYTETGLKHVPAPSRFSEGNVQIRGVGRAVTYNPRRDETFIHRDDGSEFTGCERLYGVTNAEGNADCRICL